VDRPPGSTGRRWRPETGTAARTDRTAHIIPVIRNGPSICYQIGVDEGEFVEGGLQILEDPDRLALRDQQVVGLARTGNRHLADRNARSGRKVESSPILNDPSGQAKLPVNIYARQLFRIGYSLSRKPRFVMQCEFSGN
jgi:hypothetical protein